MKRQLLLAILFHALVVITAAQRENQQTENWRTAQPQYDAFEVESPADLEYLGGKDSNDSRKYWSRINNTYVYAFSDPVKKPRHNDKVQKFISSLGQKGVETSFQGFPATGLTFEDEDGFRHRILIVKTYARILSFHVLSQKEQTLAADRFFESITIRLGSEARPANDEIVEPKEGSSPIGSGRSGASNQPAPQERPPIIPSLQGRANSPVKILSNPKAVFTDFARFYEISGSARMKVTLLADGTIGSVTPVTRLPFGLTGRAIAAAKSIRFNPALRDGVPYTVIKTFEYVFTIY